MKRAIRERKRRVRETLASRERETISMPAARSLTGR
jgi:hypothetical protein